MIKDQPDNVWPCSIQLTQRLPLRLVIEILKNSRHYQHDSAVKIRQLILDSNLKKRSRPRKCKSSPFRQRRPPPRPKDPAAAAVPSITVWFSQIITHRNDLKLFKKNRPSVRLTLYIIWASSWECKGSLLLHVTYWSSRMKHILSLDMITAHTPQT